MKNLLVISSHSFVDVITNSSTELFVCNSDKTEEHIISVLEEKYKLFKEMYKDDEYISEFSDDLCKILEIKKITDADIEKADKERKENSYGYWMDDYGVELKKGDFHIKSVIDNSIPYEFFDVIENTFNARRFHLG